MPLAMPLTVSPTATPGLCTGSPPWMVDVVEVEEGYVVEAVEVVVELI